MIKCHRAKHSCISKLQRTDFKFCLCNIEATLVYEAFAWYYIIHEMLLRAQIVHTADRHQNCHRHKKHVMELTSSFHI